MLNLQDKFFLGLFIIGMIMLATATIIAFGDILRIYPNPNPLMFGGLLFGGTSLTLPLPIAQVATYRKIKRACGL